ncbi:MAG: GAF domain-containing protein [Anaerolineae bacterium]|nr:GAF domain-containing protein [Anaerolineae bacterium]
MSNKMNAMQLFENNDEPIWPNLAAGKNGSSQKNWTVLIIDDEQDVHQATELALRRFVFNEKGLDFLNAYSTQEAKAIFHQQKHNIAVVLLDVVLEENDSGLKLIEFIRNELNDQLVRIILRTGQPGQSPAKEVILKYEINDYKLKSELTAERLFATMVTAIRAYDDLRALEIYRQELAEIYTELKSTEQALKHQQTYLRQIIDINPHFVFAKDREGHFTLANQAFAEAYGATVEEIIGKTDSDFNPHTSLVERYNRDDLQVIETGQDLFIEEEQVVNIKGQSLWRKTVKRPILDDNGHPFQVLGVATDITELKKTELALRESEERLRTFVGALPDITFIKDENGLYVEVLAAEDIPLYQGAVDLLKGKYVHEVMPPDKAELFLKVIHTTLETGRTQIVEYELDTPLGRVWFEGRTSPIHSHGNELRRVVWLARDISEHKRLEQQVRQSLDRRERQIRVVTQIAQETARATHLDDLYRKVVAQIKEQFGFYHVELFRHETEMKKLSLVAGYGEIGRQMLFEGYQVPLGRGVVGLAAAIGASVRRSKLLNAADWQSGPRLPNTGDELAVPIQFGQVSADTQKIALQGFVDNQLDGIIISPIDPDLVAPVAKAALDQGIKVISQSIDLGQPNQTSFVGVDNYKAGYLLGEQAGRWAKNHLPVGQSLSVALFNYPFSQIVERETGIMAGIRDHFGPNFEIIAREEAVDPAGAASITHRWLQRYPDLNMVLSINDASALGAYRALSETDKNKADKFFIGGIDATNEGLNALAEGNAFQITVNQSVSKIAKISVRTLVAALVDQPYEIEVVIDPEPITRQNLDGFLVSRLRDWSEDNGTQLNLVIPEFTIGLSVMDRNNPFFADLIEAVAEEVGRLGGHLIVNDPKPVLGILNVHIDAPDALDTEDQLVLEGLCGQIAVAIEKTRLIEEVSIFRQFAETSGQGWGLVTLEGQTAYVNPALAAMMDTSPADLMDRPLTEFYEGKSRHRLENEVLPAVWQQGQWSGESSIGSVANRTIPTLENYFLLKDNNNIPTYIAASITDISERKIAETAIVKQATELQTVAAVSTKVATTLDEQKLLQEVVDLTQSQFNLYHAHIYLLNDAGDKLELVVGSGEVGRQMVTETRSIALDHAASIVARTARNREGIIANDVGQDVDFLPHPLLPETQSEMAVPMIAGSRLIGVFDVQADEVDRFTEQDIQIQTVLAAQIAVALQNVRQYQQAERQATIIDSAEVLIGAADAHGKTVFVNRKGLEMLGYDGLDEVIGKPIPEFCAPEVIDTLQHEILPHLFAEGSWRGENLFITREGHKFPVDQTLFLVKNKEGGIELIATSVIDITERKQAEIELETRLQELNALQRMMSNEGWRSFLATQEESVQGYLFDQNVIKPVMAEHDDDLRLDLPSLASTTKASQVLTRPISLGGEVIGQLGIQQTSADQPLSAEDQEFLSLVVDQVSEAMERARLLEQTQKRAIELETVAQVGTIAATTLEVETLLQTVVDLTKSSFGLYHTHIYLLNEREDTLVLAAGAGEIGRQLVSRSWMIPRDKVHSLVALAVRTQEGVVANDVRLEPDFLVNPLLPDTRSELAVPLMIGERVLGVFDVQDDTPNRFTEIDVRIQTTLATQIAVALENARLFEQQRVGAAELEKQARRLAVLNEMSAELTAVQSLDIMFKIAAGRAKEIFKDATVIITLLTEQGTEFEFVIIEENEPNSNLTLPVAGTAVGQAIKANQLLNYPDFTELDWLDTDRLLKEGFNSALIMPLLNAGKIIGTFNVVNKNINSFSPADESLMRQLGAILSSIIESRHLFEQTQTALAETETLYDLVGMLSTATNLEDILHTAISPAIGVSSAELFIIEVDAAGQPEWLELRVQWSMADQPQAPLGSRFYLPNIGLSKLWISNPDEPLLIGKVFQDNRVGPEEKELFKQYNVNATVILPLKLGEKWIGLIPINWPEIQQFTDRDRRLYQSIAAQTTVVVNNLLLLEQTQLNLIETQRRYQVASRISEAHDLQELMTVAISEGPVQIFNRALLFAYERSDAQYEVGAVVVMANWYSGQGDPPSPIGRRYPLAEFPSFKLTLSSDPVFIDNAQMDEQADPAMAIVAQRQDIKAMIVLPLRASGRPQGALFLQSNIAYEFTQRDREGYLALSPQIAAAVENQRLLEETRQALGEVESVQRRYTVQAWDTYSQQQTVYGYQKVDEQVMPITSDRMSIGFNDFATNGKTTVIEASPNNEMKTDNGDASPKESRSNLVVPLTVRNEVIGFLGLEEMMEANQWSAEEIALVEAIAEQIAQAAENIRLLDETQSRAAREQRVNEIGEKIQAAQSLEEALQIAVKEVGLSLKAPQTTIQLNFE